MLTVTLLLFHGWIFQNTGCRLHFLICSIISCCFFATPISEVKHLFGNFFTLQWKRGENSWSHLLVHVFFSKIEKLVHYFEATLAVAVWCSSIRDDNNPPPMTFSWKLTQNTQLRRIDTLLQYNFSPAHLHSTFLFINFPGL